MDPQAREVVLERMMAGFYDLAKEAGTRVTGGQTTLNAWPLIGGVAMAAAKEEDFIRPEKAVPGDVLVLTKPLGTQIAVNLKEWISTESPLWERVESCISKEEALRSYDLAMGAMSRLNKIGAQLMHKYGAHGATDVTGFGILGHARNLCANQKESVDFVLETLPVLRSTQHVDQKLTGMFKLLEGWSAETSGGLLMTLPGVEAAEAYCKEIFELEGEPAWIVGKVIEGERKAYISEDVKIIEV
eukprot:CAMPEP_0174261402 /NCGR_PEP_ID=MMETSP0439-20130205/11411_1 /TAXON_ID=0 /ORGANISM="Stereomyxa ramosa, Strain Chinc5" /LENGTH=243 /DNA_ID=CAMNT_0015345873 /DNA_START=346 /DNA_END=1077 /DNA_ORIENTATION=+